MDGYIGWIKRMHQIARKGEVIRTDMMGWEEQVG